MCVFGQVLSGPVNGKQNGIDDYRKSYPQVTILNLEIKVNQFFTQQLGYIATKLDAVKEGDRTLLDNSMILFASSIVRGFRVQGFIPAFWGAVVLALLGIVIRSFTRNA